MALRVNFDKSICVFTDFRLCKISTIEIILLVHQLVYLHVKCQLQNMRLIHALWCSASRIMHNMQHTQSIDR